MVTGPPMGLGSPPAKMLMIARLVAALPPPTLTVTCVGARRIPPSAVALTSNEYPPAASAWSVETSRMMEIGPADTPGFAGEKLQVIPAGALHARLTGPLKDPIGVSLRLIGWEVDPLTILTIAGAGAPSIK